MNLANSLGQRIDLTSRTQRTSGGSLERVATGEQPGTGDPNGSRPERRLWAKQHGKFKRGQREN